jgi:hypothetical protein
MEGVANSILPPTSRQNPPEENSARKKLRENFENGGKRLKKAELSLIVFHRKQQPKTALSGIVCYSLFYLTF